MLAMVDGRERTAGDFEELGRMTGWKLETIKPGPGMGAFIFSKVEV